MSTKTRIVVVVIALVVLAAASLPYLLASRPVARPPSIVVAPSAVAVPPVVVVPADAPKLPDRPPSLRSMNAPDAPHRADHASRVAFALDYPQLVARANKGDIDAAKALYQGLQQCADAPHSQAELDAQLSLAQSPDSIRFTNQLYRDCASFSAAQLASARNWLARAAKAGDAKAQLDYVQDAAPLPAIEGANYANALNEYETNAKQYLDSQLAAGNVDALLAASFAYADPAQPIFRADPVKEYAYLYAYVQATGATGVFFNSLAKKQGRMSQEMIDQATKEGVDIYMKCCTPKGRGAL